MKQIKTTKSHCNSCLSETMHRILKTAEIPWTAPEDKEVFGSDTYEMLQCCGCQTVSLRHTEFFSEAVAEDDPGTKITVYPPRVNRRHPTWIYDLPTSISPLLSEVYAACAADARSLAAMGLRAIIDEVANNKVGDCGGFHEKLTALVSGEFISSYEKETLEAALEAGHAAMHRAYRPPTDVLDNLLDITENLLQSTYVLREKAEELRKKTPKRKQSQ